MRGMQVTVARPSNVGEFLAHAGEFLAAREAEHNLLFGICSTIQSSPETFETAPRFAVVTADGAVAAAALQTPPYNVVLSMVDEVAAMREDQRAARARALYEAERGDGLAGARGVLEPEALGRVWVLRLLGKLALLVFAGPVLRLLGLVVVLLVGVLAGDADRRERHDVLGGGPAVGLPVAVALGLGQERRQLAVG